MTEQPRPPKCERYPCPLSSCNWHFDMSPASAAAAEYVAHPADYFGTNRMMLKAAKWHRQKAERAFKQHIDTHTKLEILTELVQAQGLVIELRCQLANQLQPIMINTDAATNIVFSSNAPTDVDEA